MDGALDDRTRSGRATSRVFWMRLTDNLFRRLWLFAIPVVLLGIVGVIQVGRVEPSYASTGVLSASTNPLLSEQEVRGAAADFWETPADTTSRIIREQLRTDHFTMEVVERVGLLDEVESGLLPLDTVRDSIRASANGTSLLTVTATWTDPETSYLLAQATIDSYLAYLTQTVASDSAQAEEYYRELLIDAQDDVDEAEREYLDFVEMLPELESGEERPPEDAIRIQRLSDHLSAAEDRVDELEANIAEVVLSLRQAQSQAGEILQVIDAPTPSTAPESSLLTSGITVVSYVIIGFVMAFAALLVTTILDHSVALPAQLLAIPGVALVATVPPLDDRGPRARRSRRSRRRNERTAAPSPDDLDGEVGGSADPADATDTGQKVTV